MLLQRWRTAERAAADVYAGDDADAADDAGTVATGPGGAADTEAVRAVLFGFVEQLAGATAALSAGTFDEPQAGNKRIAVFCNTIAGLGTDPNTKPVPGGGGGGGGHSVHSRGRAAGQKAGDWTAVAGVVRLLRGPKLLAILASAATVAHNCVQPDHTDSRLSVSRYGLITELFPPAALAHFKPIAKQLVDRNQAHFGAAQRELPSMMYCDMVRDVLEAGVAADLESPAYRFALGILDLLILDFGF